MPNTYDAESSDFHQSDDSAFLDKSLDMRDSLTFGHRMFDMTSGTLYHHVNERLRNALSDPRKL